MGNLNMDALTLNEVTPEDLFEKLGRVKIGGSACQFDMEKCAELAPIINEINQLKAETDTVILAHSYAAPEIIYGVSDFVGDSYGLSKDAQSTSAERIIFSAVKFMAETAKILNPEKEVYIPAQLNGCSLADSITGADVRALRQKFPGHVFVCYINTTAEVKAECDVCVTSSNAYKIIAGLPQKDIVFVPDKLMGLNLREELARNGVRKNLELYEGVCYVHEKYDPEMIEYLRLQYPGLKVLSHPECSPGIVRDSNFVGSTSELLSYVKKSRDKDFLLLTECGLSSRLQVEIPDVNFVGSCTQCKYMKANSLENILETLKNPSPHQKIELSRELMDRARKCIDAMFYWAER